MVDYYASVCSLPPDPSFSSSNKHVVEKAIREANAEEEEIMQGEKKPDLDILCTLERVKGICLSLNSRTAAGPDDISPAFLKEGGDVLWAALSSLFSGLLHHGYAPTPFRLAHVYPIYKGEGIDRSQPSSYRPISLTSVVSKCMERCLLPHFQHLIEPHLTSLQAGFRAGFSTTDQIYRVSRAICTALAESSAIPRCRGSFLPVAFLDLSKAFDRVWIDGLLCKARKCGVTGAVWMWLQSFLSNRSIAVSAHGVVSTSHSISAGVPQGCVLSPTLFLIFVNDMATPKNCHGCGMALFADDIAIWPSQPVSAKKLVGMVQLEQALLALGAWAADWRMIFNVSKSCVVKFTSSRTDSASAPLSLKLCNQQLPQKSSFRYLGVVFDAHGDWIRHFQHVLPRVRFATNRICRIIRRGHHPTFPVVVQLVKTQVLPILTYGFPIVHYTAAQCRKLTSMVLTPLKRSLSVFATASHAALYINARLLDIPGLWKKSALSFAHRLHKGDRSHPAPSLFSFELSNIGLNLYDGKAPQYTLSFVDSLKEIEQDLHIRHDQHFSSRELKDAANRDMLCRMKPHSKAPFLASFVPASAPASRMDHHLRADAPCVIALRSRLRFDTCQLNASMHHKKMRASQFCPFCPHPFPETLSHVLLVCSHYDAARTAFIASLGFRPPDAQLCDICLGCAGDRYRAGHRPSKFELASAAFLFEIDKLRPDCGI